MKIPGRGVDLRGALLALFMVGLASLLTALVLTVLNVLGAANPPTGVVPALLVFGFASEFFVRRQTGKA